VFVDGVVLGWKSVRGQFADPLCKCGSGRLW
jgi:hypothetical protein